MTIYAVGVTHDVDDKRALFQRVVDDIVGQIRTGKLNPGDVLPTARRMADHYQVASMTAQRALRELQTMGLTYGIVGKGTFVHPQAPQRVRVLDGQATPDSVADIIADPNLNAQLAEYLLNRDALAEVPAPSDDPDHRPTSSRSCRPTAARPAGSTITVSHTTGRRPACSTCPASDASERSSTNIPATYP